MKTVEDLREHLFQTLEGLRNKSITIEEAKAVASVGQVIVNSAKVEAEVMKTTRYRGTGFLPEAAAAPGTPRLVSPMGNK